MQFPSTLTYAHPSSFLGRIEFLYSNPLCNAKAYPALGFIKQALFSVRCNVYLDSPLTLSAPIHYMVRLHWDQPLPSVAIPIDSFASSNH